MKVKDIMAITKAENGFEIYSEDGNTLYGIENGYWKMSDAVKNATVKTMTAGLHVMYIRVSETFQAYNFYDSKNHI